ncbi:hypothetical protein K4K49_005095 [Colletotrichum sp. SAR 10_70]|nr:hypothetical protein K4K49_005095 [Colletotrichum sp. SAR 10_70]KAI8180597.1 hypothetical protein K4K51_002496 [Colletotrichum sp. SAR 10_75]KAI8227343.1 hypothetical protein K4K53_005889 [Colletotrichum sp. SAR 10_77]
MSHELVIRSNTLDSEENKAKENELDWILRKPGFGLPLGHMPDAENRFPLLYMDDRWGGGWRAATLLIRECCMMKFINALSDKPEWWRKVQDDEIAGKWKKEALSMDWTLYLKHADFTPAMADACISELKKKAVLYEKTGLMPVLDYSIAVIKSDAIMTPDMAASLRKGVKPLEEVPAEDKDWHPNSNEQVLDLVHPSLWPLMYGRSRVLRDRVIGLDDALEHCGMGTVLPKRKQKETEFLIKAGSFCEESITILSDLFQWLPCDVKIDPTTGKAKIASYINNLHPKEHSDLYAVIERFIEKSLPAWDIIYNWEKDFSVQRLRTDEAGFGDCPCPELCQLDDMDCSCEPWKRPVGEDEEPRDPDDEEQYDDEYKDSERKKLDDAWFFATHALKLPDADPLAEKYVRIDSSHVKTHGFFNNKSQVQVIVKLANIHLTPDKPSYAGGSWHTEGQLNEHIVSTALFYYDSENITECTLDFRTSANGDELDEGALSYEQYDHRSIERTFAVQQYQSIFQDIGSVVTKSGRALFFPNLLQHHVSSFRLADPTKEGHRKILALFLVDPAIEICLTFGATMVPSETEDYLKVSKAQGCTAMRVPRATEKGDEDEGATYEQTANEVQQRIRYAMDQEQQGSLGYAGLSAKWFFIVGCLVLAVFVGASQASLAVIEQGAVYANWCTLTSWAHIWYLVVTFVAIVDGYINIPFHEHWKVYITRQDVTLNGSDTSAPEEGNFLLDGFKDKMMKESIKTAEPKWNAVDRHNYGSSRPSRQMLVVISVSQDDKRPPYWLSGLRLFFRAGGLTCYVFATSVFAAVTLLAMPMAQMVLMVIVGSGFFSRAVVQKMVKTMYQEKPVMHLIAADEQTADRMLTDIMQMKGDTARSSSSYVFEVDGKLWIQQVTGATV